MKNAFGAEIFEISDIVRDAKVESAIRKMLFTVLGELMMPAESISALTDELIDSAKNHTSLEEYERSVYDLAKRDGLDEAFPFSLYYRSVIVYNELRSHLIPGSVLDLGCGDGKIGQLAFGHGRDVFLADVFEHPKIKDTGLEFVLFNQGESVPLKDSSFDNTLSLYVYHHSDDPVASLRDAHRVTRPGGRVIVMESVYGVTGEMLDPEQREKADAFIELSSEQQRMCNSFFDHFWNRIFMYSEDTAAKINVPFNFNTPEGWKEVFAQNGLVQEEVVHLGFDQPSVPEYHTMHVLRVEK